MAPILIYEVDLENERYATRMVEIYEDGRIKKVEEPGFKFITEASVPTIQEINEEYPDFFAQLITKEEFETIYISDYYNGEKMKEKMDNTTPINAGDYDKSINNTLPYYSEFFEQTFDVIEQWKPDVLDWLDLGCGTGTLEELAYKRFDDPKFVLVDPSSKMLEQAKQKLDPHEIRYVCCGSDQIEFDSCFNVVTAIQAHHYMKEKERRAATENVYKALRSGGIYISFENVLPEDEALKDVELKRWGRYQIRHGKTKAEADAHNARCGVNYFPITVEEHIRILREAGFKYVHVFWYSYMQMGIYAIK